MVKHWHGTFFLTKLNTKIVHFSFSSYEFIKQTIVYINAHTITIVCPDKCLYMEHENSTLKGLIGAETSASMTFYRFIKFLNFFPSVKKFEKNKSIKLKKKNKQIFAGYRIWRSKRRNSKTYRMC